jgi:hypothetical protein
MEVSGQIHKHISEPPYALAKLPRCPLDSRILVEVRIEDVRQNSLL